MNAQLVACVARAAAEFARTHQLSDVQQAVVHLVVLDEVYDVPTIAARRKLSVNTVKSQVRALLQKSKRESLRAVAIDVLQRALPFVHVSGVAAAPEVRATSATRPARTRPRPS